jgi:hypothetical protein
MHFNDNQLIPIYAYHVNTYELEVTPHILVHFCFVKSNFKYFFVSNFESSNFEGIKMKIN